MEYRILVASDSADARAAISKLARAQWPQSLVDCVALSLEPSALPASDAFDSIICQAGKSQDLQWIRRVRNSGNDTPILLVGHEMSGDSRKRASSAGATAVMPLARGFEAIFEHFELMLKLRTDLRRLREEIARGKRLASELERERARTSPWSGQIRDARSACSAPEALMAALSRTTRDPSEDVLNNVLMSLFRRLKASSAFACLFDRETKTYVSASRRQGRKVLDLFHVDSTVGASPEAEWRTLLGNEPMNFEGGEDSGLPRSAQEWMRRQGCGAMVTVPLRLKDQMLGGLFFGFLRTPDLDDQRLREALTLADETGVVLRLAQAAEYWAVTRIAEERGRIAGDMHDTVAQGLAGLMLNLELALTRLPKDSNEARSFLESAGYVARETHAHVRRAIWNLRSDGTDERDLANALARLSCPLNAEGKGAVEVSFEGNLPPIHEEVASNLFQIAREAVANAFKHARALCTRIHLFASSSLIRLVVVDDGRGFEVLPKNVRRGFGLEVMEKRADRIGGSFTLESKPGAGTRIIVIVPISPVSKDAAES